MKAVIPWCNQPVEKFPMVSVMPLDVENTGKLATDDDERRTTWAD